MKRYFRVEITRTEEIIGVADTDEAGKIDDRLGIPDEFLDRFLGPVEAAHEWVFTKAEEITADEARREDWGDEDCAPLIVNEKE